MNSLLYYLLQVVVASGILYLYYHIALRNKQFHQYNRFYLLGAVVISILIPFLNIPVYFTPQETRSSIVFETLTVISSPAAEQVDTNVPAVLQNSGSVFNPYELIYYAYLLIAALVSARIAYSLFRISRMKRNNAVEKIDTIFFVNTNEPGTPFSFFRWLFWNKDIELHSEKGEQIFRHELFHIQQKHSIDLLFMELLSVVFWINPFFHLMKKEIRAIHEFLADQFAVTRSNKWNYAELLLMQALRTKHSLVNPFFHNQIKRRIAMITKHEKTSHRYLRKLLVLPVAVLIVTLFAFKYKQASEADIIPAKEMITVVIDAGHGGIDPGVKSPDGKYTESQIAFAIAQKIKELAPSYNINVVMTREEDKLPGNTTSSSEGNRKRVEIANGVKPAAFVALHVNSQAPQAQNKLSGFEVYVANKREDKEGVQLGSAILQELSGLYKTTMELQKRKTHGIYVLDDNNCPAVLVQCGYISNTTDLAFITDAANQEKIAKSILSALVAKVHTTSAPDPATLPAGYTLTVNYNDTPMVQVKPGVTHTFPGGASTFEEFANKNIDQRVPVTNNAPAGTYDVKLAFDVDVQGRVNNIRPITKFGYGMEDEAIRILTVMDYWPVVPKAATVNNPITIDVLLRFVVPANQTTISDYKLTDITVTGYSTAKKQSGYNPYLGISTFKKATLQQLMELDENTEIVNLKYTSDTENGQVLSVNYVPKYSEKIFKDLFNESKPGRLITLEDVIIRVDGKEKKVPSRLYYIMTDKEAAEKQNPADNTGTGS
jgi:N-acetylmuramoyl-L-alanine amidase